MRLKECPCGSEVLHEAVLARSPLLSSTLREPTIITPHNFKPSSTLPHSPHKLSFNFYSIFIHFFTNYCTSWSILAPLRDVSNIVSVYNIIYIKTTNLNIFVTALLVSNYFIGETLCKQNKRFFKSFLL